MTTYLCNDGNAEIEIEADTAQEAAEEYVDGGGWGEITKTTWINVYVQEISSCEHAHVTGNTCDECGESCEWDDAEGEEPVCTDNDCPIHGDQHVGDPQRIKVALDPDEPPCAEGHTHEWEDVGVKGHGGGVVVTEKCAHCGVRQITDTWAQDRETGEQGLTSIEYEEADEAGDDDNDRDDYDV